MKRLFLSAIALIALCANTAWGQDKLFKLTPDGFVSTDEETSTYQVVEFEGLSQQELFDKVLLTINSLYVSPQDVVSKIEGKAISVNGFGEDVVLRTKQHHFSLNYTLNFEFRDGRIRINCPVANRITTSYMGYFSEIFICKKVVRLTYHGDYTIFNPRYGDLNLPMAKETLENYINAMINTILFSRSENEEW